MKGNVKVCSLTSSNECVSETTSGHEQEKCGFWKTLGLWFWKTLVLWFSFYEIKEAASQGGYFEWHL